MERKSVYALIDNEREYQERTWPSNDGHAHSEHAILLLEGYVTKAREAWLTSKSELPVLQQLAKVAAIAVRGLEKITGSEDLLTRGLR